MTREEAAELLRAFTRDESRVPPINPQEFVRTYLDVTGARADQGWGGSFEHRFDSFASSCQPAQAFGKRDR